MLELLPQKEKPPFDEFYQLWHQRTVQYIYKKIGNLQDAEDIAGDVFLYCLDHYSNYDPARSSVSTWLFLVVNSRIKNYYRDTKDHVALDAVEGLISDDQVDLDECLYWEDVLKKVAVAVEQLDERKQKIIKLRYFEEKTSDEIATIMGITPVNARVMLSRAINALEKYCSDLL